MVVGENRIRGTVESIYQLKFSCFLAEINEVALKYMKAEAAADRKTRQITLISAPTDDQAGSRVLRLLFL